MELTQFDLLKAYANKYYDGHFTVMKFTTNYRVAFGTIHANNYHELREEIARMAEGKSLESACENCIKNEVSLYDVPFSDDSIVGLFNTVN
ncbi:hypothetical protein QI052_09085 [Staphylococcus saprophyticus]|nr:hypothetical protein [Staphylococcus saprophyticus]